MSEKAAQETDWLQEGRKTPRERWDAMKAKARRWARITWMVTLTLGAVLVAWAFGSVMARILLEEGSVEHWGWFLAAGGAMSLTFIWAGVQHILVSLQSVLNYIHGESEEPLYPKIIVLAGMVAVVTCGLLLLSPHRQEEAPSPVLAHVFQADPSTAPEDGPVAVFPVFFSLAKGPGDDWQQGVELNGSQKEAVEQLTASLAACAGEGDGEEVRISFQGFADDNDFQLDGGPHPDHDELNRQLADRRALEVYERMKEGTPELELVAPERWADPQSMHQRRGFFTLRLADEPRDQGYLNRRVDIVLWKAGKCEWKEAPAAPPAPGALASF